MCRASCLVLLCVVLAGCGGDDEPSSAQPAQTEASTQARGAKDAFIAQVDAFCKDANKTAGELNTRLRAIQQRYTNQPDAFFREAAGVFEEGYRAQRRHQSTFAKFTPPPGDQETWDRIVQGTEEQVAVLRRVVDATRRRDLQRFRSLVNEQNAASTKLDGLLQGYGFNVCGSGENRTG